MRFLSETSGFSYKELNALTFLIIQPALVLGSFVLWRFEARKTKKPRVTVSKRISSLMRVMVGSRKNILVTTSILLAVSIFFLDAEAIDNGELLLVLSAYLFMLVAAALVVKNTSGLGFKIAWGAGSFLVPAFVWTFAWTFLALGAAMTRSDDLHMGDAEFTERLRNNLERDIGFQLSDGDRIIHSSKRTMYWVPEVFYQFDLVISVRDPLKRQGYLSNLVKDSVKDSIGPSYRKEHLCSDGETRLQSLEAFNAICSSNKKTVMSRLYEESGPHISAIIYPEYDIVWIKVTDLP